MYGDPPTCVQISDPQSLGLSRQISMAEGPVHQHCDKEIDLTLEASRGLTVFIRLTDSTCNGWPLQWGHPPTKKNDVSPQVPILY